jgi:hypothetical protein
MRVSPAAKMTRSTRSGRDWTSIREWSNLAVGIGALLVAIVSVWTTAQISGLEDYFRSEISRRNSDLNGLADQGRRLNALADEREKRLADLQTTTEQVTASSLEAQGKLLATQQELSRLGFAVVNAKQSVATSEARLALLRTQSDHQSSSIDLYKRQRFFEQVHLRVLWRGYREDQHGAILDGEAAYKMITSWAVGEFDPELAPYLDEFISNAKNTCEWIRSYRPGIPEQLSFPPGPMPLGGAARAEWEKRWEAAGESQRRALDASEVARKYVLEATGSCMCRALATARHTAKEICGGYEKVPQRPASPS